MVRAIFAILETACDPRLDGDFRPYLPPRVGRDHERLGEVAVGTQQARAEPPSARAWSIGSRVDVDTL